MNFSITAGNDYRQKCGTSETISNTLTITAIGTSENYIIIGAYNANSSHEDGGNETFGTNCSGGSTKPEIRMSTPGIGTLFSTGNGGNQYLEINSVKLTNAEAVYIKSNHNRVRFCYVYNMEWGFRIGHITGADGDFNTVEFNYIDINDAVNESGPSGDPIEIYTRGQNNTVQYNWITGYDHGGINLFGGDSNTIQYNYLFGGAIDAEDYCIGVNINANNNVIRWNFCKDAGQGYHHLGGNGNEIYQNVFTCNGANEPNNAACVQLQSQTSAYSSTGNKLYNNVIYDHDNHTGWASGIQIYSNADHNANINSNEFYNNIILKVDDFCIRVYDTAGVIGTNYFYNNSCYDYEMNKYAMVEGSTYTTASAFNSRADAANNRDDDPGLKNPSAGQFWPINTTVSVAGNGYNLGINYNQILDPDDTDFTASPPKVNKKAQPVNWFIGAYDSPGSFSKGGPVMEPPAGFIVKK